MENVVAIWDERCERQVLQNCMSNLGAYVSAKEYVDEGCFYNYRYRELWKAINNAALKGYDLNITTVFAELSKIEKEANYTWITEVNSESLYTISIVPYAQRLRELSIRRKLLMIGQELVMAGTSEVKELDAVRQEALEDIKGLFELCGVDDITLSDAFTELLIMIDQHQNGGGEMTGTPSGMRMFDNKGGLQKGDFIIIGGETSQGKTALALKMAYNAIQADEPIAFYTMEMTNEQLSARMVSFDIDMSSSEILYSNSISPLRVNLIQDAMSKIKGKNLHFDDRSTSSLDTILVSIRKMKAKYDIKGAFIDYLQILNVNMKNANKEQAMGDACRRLKNLAKELDIWIVALSQLSRNSDNPVPTRNRLRDSGQIEEAADIIIFVYRPEVYGRNFPEPFETCDTKDMAMIDFAKGRNIGTFKFLMGFNAKRTLFYDVDVDKIPARQVVEEDAPF
jgi:replicative DNA helicase